MEPVSIAADVGARIAEVIPKDATICVGLSGGLDSTVLLSVLARHLADAKRVTALHVHHGLSPNADQWVKVCERLCANEGVPLAVERVRIDPSSPLGLEGAARVARYAVYASRPEPYIALAHHLDDQAETVLMQLLRGTGLKGIAAMPELRQLRGTGVHIFRPLLGYSRAMLHAYAQDEGLRWIEDESNATTGPDRNFLRHDVAPLFDVRYPGWREALARFARHAGAAGDLLDDLATVDGVPAQAGAPMPLDAALGAGRVDEGEDRDRELLREPHQAQRLAVALGPRHAEVAEDLVVGVAPLLVADHHHALAVEACEAADDRGVVGERAVAVHLLEIRADGLHVVERIGALRMAGDLGDLPGVELAVDLLGELAALLRQALDLLRDVDRGVVLHEAQLLDLLLELGDGLLEIQEGGLHVVKLVFTPGMIAR